MTLSTSLRKGEVAESYVKYLLLRNGLEVSVPEITSDADVIAYDPNIQRFYRIQVKTVSQNADGRYRSTVSHGHTKKGAYTGIDYFALVDLVSNTVYWVHSSEIKGRKTITLSRRVERRREGSLNADEYVKIPFINGEMSLIV